MLKIEFARRKLCKLCQMHGRYRNRQINIRTKIHWDDSTVSKCSTSVTFVRLSASACKRHLLIQSLKVSKSPILPLYLMELGLTFNISRLACFGADSTPEKTTTNTRDDFSFDSVCSSSVHSRESCRAMWVGESVDEKDYTVAVSFCNEMCCEFSTSTAMSQPARAKRSFSVFLFEFTDNHIFDTKSLQLY